MADRLLLVGNYDLSHEMGGHVLRAAGELGLETTCAAARDAYPSTGLVQSLYQRVRRNRPWRLEGFSEDVVSLARRHRPRWLLAIGVNPLTAPALKEISSLGVRTISFLTDDPWSPSRRAGWLFEALATYDTLFTPRPANMAALRDLGCQRVELLHFGYDPVAHRPATKDEVSAETRTADVVFIGGADADRIPYIEALLRTQLRVAIYGGRWEQHPHARAAHGGTLTLAEMRTVLARATVSVCLVRRANRDQHVMRTYEEPMMGSCMVLEDTAHHRQLFPDPIMEGAFFESPAELAARAVALCADPPLRAGIAQCERRAVEDGCNTYLDRLRTMLDLDPA